MTIKDNLSSSNQILAALKRQEGLISYLKKISEYNEKYILFLKNLGNLLRRMQIQLKLK